MAQGDTNAAKQAIEGCVGKLGYGASADLAPGLIAALTCASKVYLAMGDAARATTFARDALATAERIARDPAQSADVGEALLALGQAQQKQGDASASATLARANETLRRSLGVDRDAG